VVDASLVGELPEGLADDGEVPEQSFSPITIEVQFPQPTEWP